MRVLGIDPGLARTGVAVVEGSPGHLRLVHASCLETAPGGDAGDRLAALFSALEAAVAAHAPDAAAVEELFFASNRRSAMLVSEARGVVLCVVARAGLPVASYTPLQVKEAVAGYGAATKPQVGRMTRALLDVTEIAGPDDVTDACAVAICHHHRASAPGAAVDRGAHRSGGRGMSPGLAAAVAAVKAAGRR
ncbi:MAG TPA: crossover junction endodeoxyribonuclease RuvC [Candidatus Dormibacteraeota bacterium]|nr:crossover junction endodeoxyribonuclease RuvC [Candidatus Dormibacteraeota bacterium]